MDAVPNLGDLISTTEVDCDKPRKKNLSPVTRKRVPNLVLRRIGTCAGADIMMQLDDVVGTTVCDEVRSKSTYLPIIVVLHNPTTKYLERN